jgi:hypothetical protein
MKLELFRTPNFERKTQKLTKMNITELALVKFSDFVLWWQKTTFRSGLNFEL